jgi:esterase/lipase superfamily enzyme
MYSPSRIYRVALFATVVLAMPAPTMAEDKKILVAKDGVATLEYSPKGRFLAILDKSGSLTIRDTVASRTWGTFSRADQLTPIRPAFSADETQLATAHDAGRGEVRLWNLTKPKNQPARVLSVGVGVAALAFGSKGTGLAAGGSDGLVRVFDTGTGRLLHTLGEPGQGPVRSVAFAADGKSVAVDTAEGVRLWRFDATDPSKQPTSKILAHPSAATRPPPRFSPDGKKLAIPAAKGNEVELVDPATGTTTAKITTKSPAPVDTARFISSKELAVVSEDGATEVFDTEKGKPLLAPKKAHKKYKKDVPAAIAPGSNRVATVAGDDAVATETLAPDPRYAQAGEFLRIPVFYGTNRAPKTLRDDDRARFFGAYFLTLSGLLVGFVLLAAWALPLIVVAVWRGWTGVKRTAALIAVGALLVAVLWFLRGWLWSLEAACTLGLMAIAAVFFVTCRSALGAGLQVLIVLFAWLTAWIGIAFVGATVKVQREHTAPGDFYGNERLNEVLFGRCEVTIPRLYKVGSGEAPRPASIFGIELQEDPERHVTLRAVRPLSEQQFFADVQEEMARPFNPHREAFVFIHGYNTTFQDAAFRTALLARDMEFGGVPILFSWPSWGELEDYPADEEAAGYSRDLFEEFLRKVARDSHAQRLYVIAHSMGNRMLTETLKTMLPATWPEKAQLKEVVLAAPDVDRQQFADHVLNNILGKGPRVTLYASSKDIALATSKALHKYARAGQGGDELVIHKGLFSIDATPLETAGLSHDYAFTHPAVQEDIRRLCLEGKNPDERPGLRRELRENEPFWIFEP